MLIVPLVALSLAGTVAACGDDEDSAESGGDDFATQAAAACIEGAEGVRDVNLELGYATEEADLIERLEQILEVRETALADIEALEAPEELASAFDDYLAARQDLVAATEADLAAREDGDEAAIQKAAADTEIVADEIDKTGAELDVDACAGVIPDDDAQAAEDVLHEFSTTADPETSCNPDGLVTEIFVEGGFGSVEACTKEQEKLVDNPDDLPTDIEVSDVTGIDDVVATIEYEDVGGMFDGEPSTAQLYYVDGAWKLFSIAEAT